MQIMKETDIRMPTAESAWLEFRKIRVSSEVETVYGPTEMKGKVRWSDFST